MYIYIVKNDYFRGDDGFLYKIGKSTNYKQRIQELSKHTAVPSAFELLYAACFSTQADADNMEKNIHKLLQGYRINPKREFFEIPDDIAMDIFDAIVNIAHMLHATIIQPNELENIYDDTPELEEEISITRNKQKRKATFSFDTLGIKPGEILTYKETDEQGDLITCTVISNKKVEFNNQKYSLSTLTLELRHKQGYIATAYQGPLYWYYNNKCLEKLHNDALFCINDTENDENDE